MRVLVTRPAAAAAALAASLAARGHVTLIEPLLAIEPVPDAAAALAKALSGAQAVLFTSANGVGAFAALSPRRDLPVYAVGDATAAAASSAGFTAVESAHGDLESLTYLVTQRLNPKAGPLVHAVGRAAAGDLAAALAPAGFKLRRVVLYDARPAEALAPDCIAALKAGAIDAALFFSPRTASTFVRLAETAGCAALCSRIAAVALSPAVAVALGKSAWGTLVIAREPTEAALLEALSGIGAAPANAGRGAEP